MILVDFFERIDFNVSIFDVILKWKNASLVDEDINFISDLSEGLPEIEVFKEYIDGVNWCLICYAVDDRESGRGGFRG